MICPDKKASESELRAEEFFRNIQRHFSEDKMAFNFHIRGNDADQDPVGMHKFLLCTQSPYFAALFRKENPTEVSLDFPTSSIITLMRYLYTLQLDVNNNY